MLTDLSCIELIDDLYKNRPGFAHVLDGEDTEGVYIGIKYVDDVTVVVFRGSTTFEDWARDFFAVPHEPLEHPELGMIHSGFAIGMDAAFKAVRPLLKGNVVVTGHSLGAARALIFAGLMQAAADVWTVPEVVVFGSPKPGYEALTKLLAPVKIRSYKNMDDLVTHVPFTLLNLRYEHPRQPLIQLEMPPLPDDPWHQLGAHHENLYLAGVWGIKDIPVISSD